MSIRISTTARLFGLNSLLGGTILFNGKSIVVFIVLVHGTTRNHKSKNVGDKLHFDNAGSSGAGVFAISIVALFDNGVADRGRKVRHFPRSTRFISHTAL